MFLITSLSVQYSVRIMSISTLMRKNHSPGLVPVPWGRCRPFGLAVHSLQRPLEEGFSLRCCPTAVCYRRWSGLRPAVCYRRWFSGPLKSSVALRLVLLYIFCSIVVYLGCDPSSIICNTRRGRVASASCRSESSNISLVVLDEVITR